MARVARAAVSALALATVAVPAAAQLTSCSWTYQGTTYDLSPMTTSGAYRVQDIRASTTSYIFNVCGLTAPPTTNPSNACTTSSRTRNALPAAGWQVENDGNSQPDNCYRLGGNLTTGWNFTQYDPAYPARGVVLTYPGGDDVYCPVGSPRSLSLELLCANVAPNPTSYTGASVQEVNTCNYRVQLPSLAGCPTQCLTGGGSAVCSGHGVCGFNTDAGRSQCYCYNGYQGPTCGDAVPGAPSITVEGVLLVIVCIALAGVIALVAYMLVRLRKLNVNPAAYGQLEGRFNELGQMA